MEEAESRVCPNCKREIPIVNFTIHTVHCARNIKVCPVCKEPVPQSELQEHHDKLHKLMPCKQCGESVCGTDLEDHIRDSCGHTIKSCRYCELELPRHELPAHEGYCGVRTEQCEECKEWVMIKYRQLHLDSNHGFLRLDDDPVPQPKKVPPKISPNPIRDMLASTSNGLQNGPLNGMRPGGEAPRIDTSRLLANASGNNIIRNTEAPRVGSASGSGIARNGFGGGSGGDSNAAIAGGSGLRNGPVNDGRYDFQSSILEKVEQGIFKDVNQGSTEVETVHEVPHTTNRHPNLGASIVGGPVLNTTNQASTPGISSAIQGALTSQQNRAQGTSKISFCDVKRDSNIKVARVEPRVVNTVRKDSTHGANTVDASALNTSNTNSSHGVRTVDRSALNAANSNSSHGVRTVDRSALNAVNSYSSHGVRTVDRSAVNATNSYSSHGVRTEDRSALNAANSNSSRGVRTEDRSALNATNSNSSRGVTTADGSAWNTGNSNSSRGVTTMYRTALNAGNSNSSRGVTTMYRTTLNAANSYSSHGVRTVDRSALNAANSNSSRGVTTMYRTALNAGNSNSSRGVTTMYRTALNAGNTNSSRGVTTMYRTAWNTGNSNSSRGVRTLDGSAWNTGNINSSRAVRTVDLSTLTTATSSNSNRTVNTSNLTTVNRNANANCVVKTALDNKKINATKNESNHAVKIEDHGVLNQTNRQSVSTNIQQPNISPGTKKIRKFFKVRIFNFEEGRVNQTSITGNSNSEQGAMRVENRDSNIEGATIDMASNATNNSSRCGTTNNMRELSTNIQQPNISPGAEKIRKFFKTRTFNFEEGRVNQTLITGNSNSEQGAMRVENRYSNIEGATIDMASNATNNSSRCGTTNNTRELSFSKSDFVVNNVGVAEVSGTLNRCSVSKNMQQGNVPRGMDKIKKFFAKVHAHDLAVIADQTLTIKNSASNIKRATIDIASNTTNNSTRNVVMTDDMGEVSSSKPASNIGEDNEEHGASTSRNSNSIEGATIDSGDSKAATSCFRTAVMTDDMTDECSSKPASNIGANKEVNAPCAFTSRNSHSSKGASIDSGASKATNSYSKSAVITDDTTVLQQSPVTYGGWKVIRYLEKKRAANLRAAKVEHGANRVENSDSNIEGVTIDVASNDTNSNSRNAVITDDVREVTAPKPASNIEEDKDDHVVLTSEKSGANIKGATIYSGTSKVTTSGSKNAVMTDDIRGVSSSKPASNIGVDKGDHVALTSDNSDSNIDGVTVDKGSAKVTNSDARCIVTAYDMRAVYSSMPDPNIADSRVHGASTNVNSISEDIQQLSLNEGIPVPSSSGAGRVPIANGVPGPSGEPRRTLAKRSNDQPQINTAVAGVNKVHKDMATSRGAVKKRPAPKPPADRKRDLQYYSALQRQQAEDRQRQEQSAYNASVGLPPVLSPVAKLEKLRKMDALHNREVENNDYKNKLQGRVWMNSTDASTSAGHRLGSDGPVDPNVRNELRNLKPMTPAEFMVRFEQLQLDGDRPDTAAKADRFSEIKSSLRELRRGLNEVTAPYNSNAGNNHNSDRRRRRSRRSSSSDEELRDDLQVDLPCEFCGAPVPAQDLVQHQTGCRPDLTQFRPRSRSPQPAAPPPRHEPPPLPADPYENPVIPCEFCTESLPVYLISEHQERCRRDPNLLFPD